MTRGERHVSEIAEQGLVFLLHVLGVDSLRLGVGVGVVFEVARIGRVVHARDDRALDPAVEQVVPIDPLKERVRLDARSAARDIA